MVALDVASLVVRPKGPSGYSIALSTAGCLSNWDLEREGEYANGILSLNKPVKEYGSSPYDTLYAVSVAGADYLISQDSLLFLMEHYSMNCTVDWRKRLPLSAFRRIGAESTQPATSR